MYDKVSTKSISDCAINSEIMRDFSYQVKFVHAYVSMDAHTQSRGAFLLFNFLIFFSELEFSFVHNLVSKCHL